MNWLQASCLLHTSRTNQLSQYWKAVIMRNSDILLWFIRKKHRNQKYDLFLCCSLCHFGSSHSLLQNALNVNLVHKHTHFHAYRHITHKTKHAKTLGRYGLASGSCFIRFYLRNLGHISIWRKTKKGNKLFSQETSCNVPIWERSFALFDIQSASHNPTVAPQPPLKSARITYDTISCNNEATKETGI